MTTPIKGFPSNNKVSSQRDLKYVTVDPVGLQKDALSVKAYVYSRVVGADAVEANTTTDTIVATGHAALAGDMISFTSGALSGLEFVVQSVLTDAIILTEHTSVAASATDTFDILRQKAPVVSATGSTVVNVSDGTDTLQIYQEDAASAGGEFGLALLGVRNDAGASPVSADGDFQLLQFDANGNLRTTATVTEAAVYAEDTAHVSGDDLKAMGAVRNDASAALTSADGDYSPVAVDSAGRIKTVIESVIPGVSATALGKAEDSVHASGDVGVMSLAVRQDATAPLAADGDYTPLQTDANGNLKVAATITEQAVYAEDTAHTTGDNGKFVLAVRNDAASSLVSADGDYAPLQVDATGNLKVAATITEQAVFAEDTAHTTGDDGKFVLAVRNDAGTSLVSADGDYAPIQVDATGAVRVAGTVNTSYLDTIFQLDTPLFDASTIDDSGGAFVECVNSTSAQVNKIQALSTSGIFIGLYTGAAAAEVLKCIIGPGSDQTLEVDIPAATRLSFRSMEATGGAANEFIAINFLG